jgi:hypothetical protein
MHSSELALGLGLNGIYTLFKKKLYHSTSFALAGKETLDGAIVHVV